LKKLKGEEHLRHFCESTSHKLCNILGAVVGELDYALHSTNQKVKERSIGVALSAAEKAIGLARNLEYFSLRSQLKFATHDISQILLDTVDVVEKEFESRGIKIVAFAEADTYVRVDHGAMQEVLLNLLYNAANAMSAGGKITLNLRQRDDQVEISCADTGKGIPEHSIKQIFTPYFHIDKAASDTQGLGLAVCKALIDAHGGNITVESQSQKGATFKVTLPFDPNLPHPGPYEKKRRYRRIQANLPATLHLSDQISIESELRCLGLGGCFLKFEKSNSVRLPDLNEKVKLAVRYFDKETLDIPEARIAHVCWAGPDSGVGIEFQGLDDKAKRILSAIIQSHIS